VSARRPPGFLRQFLGSSRDPTASRRAAAPPVRSHWPRHRRRQEAGRNRASNFGRTFPNLPPFATPSDALTEALDDIGEPGGLLDAKDDLAVGPVPPITDPNQSLVNRDNPTQTAGTTFFGQFLDHDLTFDTTSGPLAAGGDR
jgi:hypothetical protein